MHVILYFVISTGNFAFGSFVRNPQLPIKASPMTQKKEKPTHIWHHHSQVKLMALVNFVDKSFRKKEKNNYFSDKKVFESYKTYTSDNKDDRRNKKNSFVRMKIVTLPRTRAFPIKCLCRHNVTG